MRYAIVLLLCTTSMASALPTVTPVKMPPTAYRPQVVIDSQGTIHMVHGHKTQRGDLFYVFRKADEKTFSKPIPVNSTPGCAAAFNMAVGKNGRIHVLIRPTARYSKDRLKRQPKFYDLKYMLYCRLNDQGTKFEEERDLSGSTFGFEGVGAVIANGKGTVYAYWHGLLKPGREPSRQIFLAKSDDEGKTFSEPKAIKNKVVGACACCSMQGMIDNSGTIYLAYRNSLPGGRKDSYLLKSKDGGASFTGRLLDPWANAGCPGSIYVLVGSSAGAQVAWDTRGQVYYMGSDDKAKKVEAPTHGNKSRSPALARNGKEETLFAWAEAERPRQFQRGGNLAWQLYDDQGKAISKKHVLKGAIARWSFPGAIALPNGNFIIFYDGTEAPTGR